MTKSKIQNDLDKTIDMLKNPRLKCVPDQITGKRFALCLMETTDEKETRIQRHISSYLPPKELIAFIWGYYECMTNRVLD